MGASQQHLADGVRFDDEGPGLKTTLYFDCRRQFPDRAGIDDEWIQRAVRNPEKTEVQSDGRIRKWARIEESGGRYLRVILLDDGETVHNVFFDRRFRGASS